ncbi:MAG: hypothetical protein KKH41_07365 [Candidatus Thermoplasmatota archaeon]|nr:hypothetical protein [Euryarchaeota archaeon]MBU4031690.1 hypothetical protein [Candidatus Thermoplasmatota archaeon]MBU4071350.1 hypothetical protein [Candidatus Thermoplasmatota archaeon]MBU4144626.1 hypothetical protein [Candidatus Thermoplasmatota archaeon]MBU4592386.1 hypothetical protein [Candidatus Thermoplasmatota archaeon]
MDEEKLRTLEKIIRASPCPVGCWCYKTRPEELCKAKIMGLESLLECMEDEPEDCSFALAFGESFFCRCATRKEIAKLIGE